MRERATLGNPEEMAECGGRGIELIERVYNWDVSAALLAESYKKMVKY